jgi:hypothetical protein
VECAFGILTKKWRIFQRQLNVGSDFESSLLMPVLFCTIIFREQDEYKFEDALTATGLEDVPDGQLVRGGLTTNSVRNKVSIF